MKYFKYMIMEKLFLFVLMTGLLMVATFAYAQPVHGDIWYRADQVTIGWDAVTQTTSGVTIPAIDVIKYKVFVMNTIDGSTTEIATDVLITEYTFQFIVEGLYYFGVMTLRYVSVNGTLDPEPETSDIAWTSDPTACFGGIAFGVRFVEKPAPTENMKKQ